MENTDTLYTRRNGDGKIRWKTPCWIQKRMAREYCISDVLLNAVILIGIHTFMYRIYSARHSGRLT